MAGAREPFACAGSAALVVVAAAAFGVLGAGAASGEVTDEQVCRAIEKAREYLIGQQLPDGTWPEKKYYNADAEVGTTEWVLLTLVYIGEHPNREVVSKGLDAIIGRQTEYTYAIAARIMALARIQKQLTEPKRGLLRAAIDRDVQFLALTQRDDGGWGYNATGKMGSSTYRDLSCTQMAVLALWEAERVGIEVPPVVWKRVVDLYVQLQRTDGSWNYGETDRRVGGEKLPGYGSMTAAGLASLYIATDRLDVSVGCPCRGGRSAGSGAEFNRRIDAALDWLDKHFQVDRNPEGGKTFGPRIHYWLYSAERVGAAAGYKYFGEHDWFKEAADVLVRTQHSSGAWAGHYGSLITTCFATLFLYKGRAPILFNKLEFDGQWNNHRRDMANLVYYIERLKEQPCHWQIVNLRRPVEELHDAPILYITAESVPPFTDEEKAKLRAFTDTGGTILFEASCGNPAVRTWFLKFAAEVWPEWKLQSVPKEHPVFADPYALKPPPELMSVHDGVRDAVFYSPADVSCAWQTRAFAGKIYLFEWGINLVRYATDDAPLRAKLAGLTKEADRYAGPVKAGSKTALRVARVRHEGEWKVNANYGGFGRLAALAKEKAGVALEADEKGVLPAELGGSDAAYLVGTRAFTLEPEQVETLKQYTEAGGLVWLESAGGSAEFDQSVQALAEQAGWRLALLPPTHPLMTGRMEPAAGYNLTSGVLYRRAMRVARLARPYAELVGLFAGDRLVGIYSPFDTMFAINPYEAYGCRGYASPDAAAVGMNVILYLTTRGQPLPGADETAEAAPDTVP